MKTITLYSTLGCHLCEHARAILQAPLEEAGYALEEVDIADSDELLERYRLTIPVARNPANGRELSWPFTAKQLSELLD